MTGLRYAAITSLDGYVADAGGGFGWAMPDEEVHSFVNDLLRPCRTHLYGRRLYEVMTAWETMPDDEPEPVRDFAALWRAADKVVYSRTLDAVTTARTTLVREFDPEAVRARAREGDLSIGGPTLAAEAFAAGLVERVDLVLAPVTVGGGTPALPPRQRVDLALVSQRSFGNGFVHLGYVVAAR